MTAAEQAALLTTTRDAPRDHVVYSMALGTGLRLRGLPGLNVGDVSPDGREVRRRVTLDPATTKGGRRGEVFLPAGVDRRFCRPLEQKPLPPERTRLYGRPLSDRCSRTPVLGVTWMSFITIVQPCPAG